MAADLDHWRKLWGLTPDGEPFVTDYTKSRLQLVTMRDGTPAVLKLAAMEEERRGNAAMAWWAGRGAARVLAHDDSAILLERLSGEGELKAMAERGGADDDAATGILCDVTLQLHQPADPTAGFIPLDRWLADLHKIAAEPSPEQPIFAEASRTALALLAEGAPPVALHGDMHHGNALRSAAGAWLAIDPKGLAGDPGYDFANILHNPTAEVAHAPGRMARQARIIAQRTNQPLPRVLRWAFIHGSLSAAWTRLEGREDWVALSLITARIAREELAALG